MNPSLTALRTKFSSYLYSNRISVTRFKFFVVGMLGVVVVIVATNIFFNSLLESHLREYIDGLAITAAERKQLIGQFLTDISVHEREFYLVILFVFGVFAYAFSVLFLRPLERAIWSRKRYTSAVIHDLRAPLSIIRVNLDLALREKDAQENAGLLKENILQVARMQQMISDILMLDRYDNVKTRLAREPQDLAAIASSIAKELKPLAESKGLSLAVNAPAPASIRGDARALERMIANLIRNAIEHTPTGGQVKVAVARHDGAVELAVRDTGTGIPPELLPHVFERFRGTGEFKKIGGLGLAIVKEIVDRHGGSIKVESEPGKGTAMVARFRELHSNRHPLTASL